jgi:predicted acylesterase/phospholipase RssA
MGPADNFEIWEVARAATAAPFYFDPIAIETRDQASRTIRIYEDGGMGQTTNPTSEGITDIEKQHGADAVGIVVSVGTARGTLKMKKNVIVGKTRETIIHGVWSQSDPGKVHQDIKSKMEHYPNMEYWRLNPSSKDAKNHGQLLNMPLDECEPKRARKTGERAGARTIREIETAFANWAQRTKVQKKLEELAQRLVAQRRLRLQNAAKWERFSMAVDYRCKHFNCPKLSSKFTNLPEFQHHLQNNHGISSERELEKQKKKSWDPWIYPRPPKKRR